MVQGVDIKGQCTCRAKRYVITLACKQDARYKQNKYSDGFYLKNCVFYEGLFQEVVTDYDVNRQHVETYVAQMSKNRSGIG